MQGTSDFWTAATLNTAIVITGVVVLTSLIAIPLAWLSERSDLPGAKYLRSVLTLPYVIPGYLLAVSWITLANPGVGWINLLAEKTHLSFLTVNVYGIPGIIFVESSALFSILYLSLKASLARLDPSLEESARLAGAGPWTVFTRISMPILRNSILLGILSVGLASFASFGVPALIGKPARKFMLTTGIYSLIQQSSAEAYGEALSVALKMVVFSMIVVLSIKFFQTRRLGFMGSKVNRPSLFHLGKARIPLAILVWSVWSLIVAIPLLVLVVSSFQVDPSSFAFENFGFQSWRKVLFSLPEFPISLRNSLITGLAAAVIVVGLSLAHAVLSWRALRHNKRIEKLICRAIEEASFLFYSLPGTVLALLLVTASAWIGAKSAGQIQISSTLGLIVFAFTLKYFSLGLSTVTPNAQLIHASLIDSAQLAGASSWQRVHYIWFPLLRPALIAALLLVLMPCLSELTMTILLYGPGTQNLGVMLFEQKDYGDSASAAVIGTMLLLAVILFQYLIGRMQREPKL